MKRDLGSGQSYKIKREMGIITFKYINRCDVMERKM